MSPEFRNSILELPLCKKDIDTPSELIDLPSKQNLLLSF